MNKRKVKIAWQHQFDAWVAAKDIYAEVLELSDDLQSLKMRCKAQMDREWQKLMYIKWVLDNLSDES